jgi:hypothetical protein
MFVGTSTDAQPVSVHDPLMANFLDYIFCHCGPTTVRPQPVRHLRLTCLTVLLTDKRKPSPLRGSVAAFCCRTRGRGSRRRVLTEGVQFRTVRLGCIGPRSTRRETEAGCSVKQRDRHKRINVGDRCRRCAREKPKMRGLVKSCQTKCVRVINREAATPDGRQQQGNPGKGDAGDRRPSRRGRMIADARQRSGREGRTPRGGDVHRARLRKTYCAADRDHAGSIS